MIQYINKSALVAEIEKREKDWKYGNSSEAKYKMEECDDILSFLNTLEVKVVGVDLGDPKGDKSAKYIIDTKTLKVEEVDFEKEWERYFKYKGDMATVNVKHLAKHFYELALKVRGESYESTR